MRPQHGLPRPLLVLWPGIDTVLRGIRGIRPVSSHENPLLCVEHRRHSGSSVSLADASLIVTGDCLLEIHLAPLWFTKHRGRNATVAAGVYEVLHTLACELAELARQMGQGMYTDVRAIHGVTFLHTGARRLGFEVRDMPRGWRYELTVFYMSGLMQMSRLTKSSNPGARRRVDLKEIWLSRDAFVTRYGASSCAVGEDAPRTAIAATGLVSSASREP
jgi:hypothetical protein